MTLKRGKGGDYTLKPSGGEENAWITVKERFSIYIVPTDEGVVVDVYMRGHEMDGALGSTYVFDDEAICECKDHPWGRDKREGR